MKPQLRIAMGLAFIAAAWHLNANNPNYDPAHLATLERIVRIVSYNDKAPEGSGFDYTANYAIMLCGAYQLARGVSRLSL